MGAGLRRAKAATEPEVYNVPCKIGTQPALARIHKRDKLEVGRWIRIQECRGDKWHWVRVTRVDADGHFFADR